MLLAATLAVAAVTPASLRSQVLFDWPVRSDVRPEALVTGAASLLWNPAGFAPSGQEEREVWIVHVDGPDASGIQGLVGSVVFDLPWLGRVGVAYQHLGIPDIERTGSSPEPEPGSLTVTEDLAVLSLAQSVMSLAGVGASVRLMRGTVGSDRRDRVAVDLGVQSRFGGRLRPGVGAALRSVGTRTDAVLGAQASVPTPWPDRLELTAGYGLQGTVSDFNPEHRLSVRGTWLGRFIAGAAALSHNGGPWTSLLELRLEVGRYGLASVRGGLPNDFGAARFFQASIGLN